MSVLRIKVVYEDDIRMFKAKSDDKELLTKLNDYVKDSFTLSEFRLFFKDDEGDSITIVDEDDLKEALQGNSSKTTKIFVKINQQKNEEEKDTIEEENITSNVDPDEDGEESNEEEEDNDNDNFRTNCEYIKFLDDISENEELKKEFVSFLSTFINLLQEDKNKDQGEGNNGSELFIQALSLHHKINKHEIMNKFVTEKLDMLFIQFPHLLNILKSINTNDIPKFIDIIIDFNNNNKNSPRSNNFPMLPPFLFPFLGLFNCDKFNNTKQDNQTNNNQQIPPFMGLPPTFFNMFEHGFRGNHGRHHRGHGRHHGHHGGRRGGRFHGRGGGRRHCGRGFFNHPMFNGNNNNFNNNNNNEKCKKNRDLRADILNENITLGKDAIVLSNQALIKTWKMKNVGEKPIPKDISIQYFGRRFNPMIDGTKFDLGNKEINVNEEFQVSVVVKSPNENGKYSSKWKLVTKDGKKFGQALFVTFIVNEEDKNNSNYNNNNYNNKKFSKEEKRIFKQQRKEEKQQRKEEKRIFKTERNLQKQERKNIKKEMKFARKLNKQEHKLNKKEDKLIDKKEKLRNQREKLLQKLQELEKQTNDLQKNNGKDDEKEIVQDITIEEQEEENNDNNNNNNNLNTNDEDKETDEGDNFIYGSQLEQLKNMGFGDVEKLKKLLEISNGSIEAVINNM